MAAIETEMTYSDAAKHLGISGSFVANLVKRGKLVGTERFGRKLVTRESVLARARLKRAGKLEKNIPRPHDWKPEELALLGMARDCDVAKRVGVTTLTVFNQRRRLKIDAFPRSAEKRAKKTSRRKSKGGKRLPR